MCRKGHTLEEHHAVFVISIGEAVSATFRNCGLCERKPKTEWMIIMIIYYLWSPIS